MLRQQLKKLNIPENPGVYIFRDYQKRPLYIGRATSLKDRVKSYFSVDIIETRGPRIVDMITKAKYLTWQETDSVLEAIILESALIKKYQPQYNVDERDDKSSYYVIITDEAWPRVFLTRVRDFDAKRVGNVFNDGKKSYKVKKIFGPYVHSGLIKEALKIVRKMFPFKDIKSFDVRHNSFYEALGRSPKGEDENSRRRYAHTISNLILFFEGKKKLLQTKLQKDMTAHAKKMEFEEAGKIKRLLYALDHVNDMALIKKQEESSKEQEENLNKFRIEACDIAHLSGTNVVGAFTVSINGEFVPSEYRKFKISKQQNNDIAGLVEILNRRLNHTEWSYPDLIVVDGGEGQLNAAENVLKARRISIPIVAVTKDDKHKASELIGNNELADKYKFEIIKLNAEAHRYVIKFHRTRRNKQSLL